MSQLQAVDICQSEEAGLNHTSTFPDFSPGHYKIIR